ncbi:mismatch repair endonuclease PMS2 [Neocloeon triangulifer]|uniref:mismatch repair endonuclease PMS2 n=1 Tax=Neocloeon triangulifer TaxID=2078957 RepID=UPI00286F0B9C|nr:mismatch repair endonuclease PMS2 [Neocloeon triangulifer]XP_059490228.1 mismatch repair endonuclease PMS2 [Neocloeon triangulifer]
MEESQPTPTIEKAKAISGLSSDVAHKICSDRVIGSIGVAVKELVENSLDAGATNITVRLKGHGLEMIEVSDNGKGVKEIDFESLAKSFHTSKLSEFSDLDAIGTFGFRGEALSSLCRVCDGLEVVTRHETADSAIKLKYDAAGDLVERCPVAGETTGTKVTLKNLFGTLPVRRKIFQEKSQIEFAKALNLLQAYGIILDGVKLQVFHQVADGKESKNMAHSNGTSVKNNMIQILGPKLVQNLLEIRSNGTHSSFEIEGFISSCAHDKGRRVPDKQYFYLNRRPVDMPQISKCINNIYKQFNKHQFPLVVLHVTTKVTESVDVNLAPDKRSVIIRDQTSLLSLVEDTLLKLYEDIPSEVDLSSSISTKCKESNSFFEKFSLQKRASEATPPATKKPRFNVYESPSLKLESFFFRMPKRSITESAEAKMPPPQSPSSSKGASFSTEKLPAEDICIEEPKFSGSIGAGGRSEPIEHKTDCDLETSESPLEMQVKSPETNSTPNTGNPLARFKLSRKSSNGGASNSNESKTDISSAKDITLNFLLESLSGSGEAGRKKPSAEIKLEEEGSSCDLKPLVAKEDQRECKDLVGKSTDLVPLGHTFTAGLDPNKSRLAEEEFNRVFQKGDFLKMKIIGQFNLGFIIASLNDDVFIIDQHASDEKFNFERLCKNTKMKSQRLVLPMKLNLNAPQELVFNHHSNVFRENGYEFKICDTAPAGQKVQLTAVPSLLHATFGQDDVLDVIYQLQDSPYSQIKSKRVRSILASKACRFSVMFGKSMSHFGMRRLVENMATMDQPWNCPHGRPTMRHLFNHTLLASQFSKNSEVVKQKPNLGKIKLIKP